MRRSFPVSPPSPFDDTDEANAQIARLYQAHAPAIFAYLRLRATTREDAEDLLLEVFLAALEQREGLEGRSSEKQRAWLRGVAAHKVADHYRRARARRQEPLEHAEENLYADETHSPEDQALHREEDERLRVLLQGLPDLQRRIIQLRFVYGLRCAEIAETLGKKEGAVRKLLWRALNLVRTRFLDE